MEYTQDEKIITEHSTDASVFKVRPKGIFYPKNVAEVVEVVKKVADEKSSVSVRAGGTCMTGGSLTEEYVLNMTKYMNKVEIDPIKKTATVETGTYFRDIEEAAKKHGLMFAPYPSSHLIAGIGGMIGNNASGEKSMRYGATIDNVLSLEVVLSSGEIIQTKPKKVETSLEKSLFDLYNMHAEHLRHAQGQVKKVASGYRLDRIVNGDKIDLTSLFVGTQGTLGIITKAVLKLVPIPKNTVLYLIPINSIKELPHILKTVLDHNPESVETFDVHTFERARLHMKDMAVHIEKFFSKETTAIILAQFDAEVDIGVAKVTDPVVVDAAWKIRRSSYSLVRDNNEPGKRAVPCVEDVIVPVERFDAFVEGLVHCIQKYNIQYAFHGHIADGALRIIPIFDFNNAGVVDTIIAFTHDVIALVKNLGGNMSSDHSDGIIRTPFLKEFYGPRLYNVFEEIKHIFDPQTIFNPYKKVGGTEAHIRKYIV
jgi:FAD/FMN-containing dehydrogenase